HRRTGDCGADLETARGLADRTDHRPDEGALTLPVRPWMEVIRDQREGEATVLGHLRVADQIGRRLLLARELVAERQRHRRSLIAGSSSPQPPSDVFATGPHRALSAVRRSTALRASANDVTTSSTPTRSNWARVWGLPRWLQHPTTIGVSGQTVRSRLARCRARPLPSSEPRQTRLGRT